MGNSNRFEGKSVLITRAGSLLGAAEAMIFAREGASLTLVDPSDEALVQVLAKIDADQCGQVQTAVVAGDESHWLEVMKIASRATGNVDVLVHHALGHRGVPIECLELDEWNSALADDLEAAFLVARLVIPIMRASGGGSIVFVSSVSAMSPQVGDSEIDSVVGGGLRILAKCLAAAYGPDGIRSNSVHLGRISADVRDVEGGESMTLGRVPLRRKGLAREAAEAVLFLSSGASGFISATELVVDGGLAGTMRGASLAPTRDSRVNR